MADNKFQKGLLVFTAYCTTAALGIYISLYEYTILTVSQLYELNASMMGVLIATQSIGMAVSPLLVSVLASRLEKKKIILTSFALLILGTSLAGVSNSFAGFIVSVFVIGAGFSVTEGTVCAILSDEFPDESKRHLNYSQVFFSVGALISPFIAEALIGAGIYFKDLYVYIAVLFAALSVLFVFTKQKNDKPAASAGEAFSLAGFFKNRVLLLLAGSIFLYTGLEATIANFADSYYELALNAPEMSALALALFSGSMIPSRFLAGTLNIDSKKLFTALSALMFTSAVAAMLVPNVTAKLILFALCGFFSGPIWPLIMDETAKRNRGSSGGSMNVMVTCCNFGGAVLPLIAGFGVNLGGESMAYYVSAAAMLIMLFALLSALRSSKGQDIEA